MLILALPSPAQQHFRIRAGDTMALNSDSGWAAAVDVPVTMEVQHRFRIRFEVEAADSRSARSAPLRLQFRRNEEAWQDAAFYPADNPNSAAGTPAVWVVASALYREGEATTDLLRTSPLPFERGTGRGSARGLSAPRAGRHTEFEFALMIPSFHDGPGQNRSGDRFQFRLDPGRPSTFPHATVTLQVPPGHIGGTYVESPNRIGPFQDSNGNLYAIQEPAETDNVFMVIKSGDGGRTWSEQDAANRPVANDLESVDAVLAGDLLHIVHHAGRKVSYHVFRVSSHTSQPDTWEIRDEVVAAPITYEEQSVALEVLPNGQVHCFYARTTGQVGRIFYRTRAGGWGPERPVDDERGVSFYGVTAAQDGSSHVHVVYASGRGEVYHRWLSPGGVLSPRQLLTSGAGRGPATRVPLLPPVPITMQGQPMVLAGYRKEMDGRIYTRLLSASGPPGPESAASAHAVSNDQAQSCQPTAFLAADGSGIYLLYAAAHDEDIYLNTFHAESGWGKSRLEKGGMEADLLRGFIFTHPPALGGGKVLGYLVDNGSDGYTGTVLYLEIPMPPAPIGHGILSPKPVPEPPKPETRD